MAAPRKTGTQRGGRKKPADQKQGRSGKSPAGKLTVLPGGKDQVTVPKAPAKLGVTAKKVWTAFWESPLATSVAESDHYALTRWIRCVQELEELRQVVSKAATVEGSTGQPRLNPVYTRIDRLEDLIAKSEQQFGMTPLARMKLTGAITENVLNADKLNDLIRKKREENVGDESPAEDGAQEFEGEFTEEFEEA